ncbi:hypothetical protein DH2020_018217 [Rehmannia glutinosa]|uniref:Dof-type domain-containing protein n=1 Tax=Rehmannia glutinosa TaxID=99300 RepID=A0ABR0WJF0_REHGL
MGRPEPCVLYAHTFVHPHLDEYVDEAVVTNHLVVRGSYRSLSMVIYGNTAEDLGQFSIEVDLDGSFTDTVSAVEGNLEDLPPAFHPTMLTIKEPVSPLKILSQAVVELDIPLELRKFLLLVFKSLDSQNLGEAADKVISSLLSVTSKCGTPCSSHTIEPKQLGSDRPVSGGDADHTVTEAGEELLDLYRRLQNQSGDPSVESSTESLFLESEAGAPTSKELMETLHQHFDFCSSAGNVGYLHLSQVAGICMLLWGSCLQMLDTSIRPCTVLSVLGGISAVSQVTNFTLDMLASAKVQLKKLLKLIKLSGPIDDLSPMAAASRFFILGDAGLLAYKTTIGLINLSNCGFSNWDIDSHLLSLLKERGFLPLSAALLSSSVLRSQTGHAIDLFVDIVSHIEAIILSLLFCRSGFITDAFITFPSQAIRYFYLYCLFSLSGLNFLLHDPEVSSTIIHALRGIENVQKEDLLSLRYAYVLMSKGFFIRPKEVGMIVEMHMRAALKVLMTALHSGRELDPVPFSTGVSPLNLAIFHSAAEIFEVIVTDSTATSLKSWIDHAKELHMALHSSSPGSNKKDAPARLLEWIDAGVVYHRNGAIGLLRYAAVLASGGDVHMASDSVLASDMMDVDNVVGDSSGSSDGNVVDNLLGKRITEKDFPGVILRDTSIAQLTTAFRILAFISDNSVVAAALYDEGAVMVIHAVMINCKQMLERSSNIYDYLVDEGGEGSSTSDLLLERNREKSLFDLLIPALVLLINLLQRLQCAYCQRLVGLWQGLSSFVFRERSQGATQEHKTDECTLTVAPRSENDLFPDESIWLWKNGMPMLSPLRAMAVGTLLGPQKEKQINWYLRPGNPEKLVAQLSPQLVKLGEIILHCAVSVSVPISVVIQDALRVLVIRIACLNLDYASLLVKPIISWISHRLSEPSMLTDVDAYKALLLKEGAFEMLTKVLEKCIGAANSDVKQFHENAKFEFSLLSWSIPVFQSISLISDGQASVQHSGVHDRSENSTLSFFTLDWLGQFVYEDLLSVVSRNIPDSFTDEEYLIFWSYLLRFCMVLPLGTELLACLSAFKGMGSSTEGQSALLSIVKRIQSSTVQDSESQIRHETNASCGIIHASEWKEHPPLLCCWTTLLRSIDTKDVPAEHVAAAIDTLASGALGFCMDGKRILDGIIRKHYPRVGAMEMMSLWNLFSVFAPDGENGKTTFRKVSSSFFDIFGLNSERVAAIKFLFGVKNDNSLESFVEENLKHIEELTNVLESETGNEVASDTLHTPHQIKETSKLLLLLLQKSSGTEEVDAEIATAYTSLLTPPVSSRIHKFTDRSMERIEDYSLDEATFFWECPENLRNRMTQTGLSAKRKISSLDGPNRHARGDNSVAETTSQSTFSRGSVPVTTPPGPTRRDTFRQRKPNTSRPPSMHVDDYVARERNADGTNSSNVIAVPRIGSSSGRPPSIHVDVFMARQRERQNVVGIAVNDTATQVKTTVPDDSTDAEKSSKPQQLKPDLDDDLQGIDIVFDAEESEPDDKLPFPQPDDNLQQPPSVVIEPRSPHSIVEETESDVNENSQFSHLGTPLASNMDENTPSEYSSRMSASRPERPLTREPSISSDKKFSEQSEDSKGLPIRTSKPIDSSASVYMNTSSSSVRYPVDSRTPPNLYPKAILQQSGPVPLGTGFQGFYDQKFPSNQPPLPPMPPPPTVSPVMSQNMDPVMTQTSSFVKSVADVQAQGPPGPNFLPPPPLMQPMLFRPGSMPVNLYGNSFVPHPGDNMHNVSQNLPISLPAVQPMPILTQLQPLQPPQIPRPPPQHLRPPVPSSPQPQVSPAHAYYQTQQQQENVSHSLQQQHVDRSQRIMQMSGDATTSQQQDSGMSLQEFFKSPEAIQSLLSDREKLCQLLEQHPKLMQMLQAFVMRLNKSQRRWIKPNVEISPPCPRCGSSNTKFCYYNNYSLTQPRYFCKGCRRYWTKGGSLRNVPVGGGCRKSRRGRSIRTDGGPSNSRNILAHNGIESSTRPSPSPRPYNVASASTSIDLAAVYANFLNQSTPRQDNRVESSIFENPDGFSVPPVGFQNLHMSNLSSHLHQEGGFFEPQLLGFGNLGFFGELDQQIVTGNGFSSINNAILPPLPGEDNNIVVNASDGVLWPGSDVILQNQMLPGPMNTVEVQERSQINPEMLNGNVVSPFSPLINLEAIFRS